MIKKKNVLLIHLLIFLISLIFQKVTLVDFGDFSLKMFHIIGLSFLVWFRNIGFKFPPIYINVFYLFGLVVSLIMYILVGFNSLILNYLFGYYILVVFISLSEKLHQDDIYKLFSYFIFITFIVVSINALIQYKSIISFLIDNYGGHPTINTLISGGVNIEASWLAIFAAFFYRKKYLNYIFTIWSIVISVIYGSRAALIADLLIFVAIAINVLKNKRIKEGAFLLVVLIILLVIGSTSDFVDILINRFLNIGSDAGSTGRLNMWTMVGPALKENLVGYGCGNAVSVLRNYTSLIHAEDNVHNLYLQFLLDFGIVGFIYIIVIFVRHLINTIRSCNPFKLLILSYFILCLLEFRGGDILFFVILGAHYSLIRMEKVEFVQNEIKIQDVLIPSSSKCVLKNNNFVH